MITIFATQERADMLVRTLEQIEAQTSEAATVILDGYLPTDISFDSLKNMHTAHQHEKTGKPGFLSRWNAALRLCLESKDNVFLFIPEDLQEINLQGLLEELATFDQRAPVVINVLNDGRGPQWTKLQNWRLSDTLEHVGWTDCAFICNRAALQVIGWELEPVLRSRFINPTISSGVGMRLTNAFNRAGVPIYRPYKSFAYHGEHQSAMHPEERKRNPLISV